MSEMSKVVGAKIAVSIARSVMSLCKLLIQIPLLSESVPCVIMTTPGMWKTSKAIPSSISRSQISQIRSCKDVIAEDPDAAIK